jgi:ribosomal protein S11
MVQNYKISFDINKFLRNIQLKKKYIKNLNNNVSLLSNIKEKNYKLLNNKIALNKNFYTSQDHLVMYIIDITFSRSNTLLHVSDSAGNLKFSRSAGSFNYSGKSKKARWVVFKEFYRYLFKLNFLKNKPIALHFKNVGPTKFWIIKQLKKKLFIKTVSSFTLYPYNGCRKKKMRRKKFKKKS